MNVELNVEDIEMLKICSDTEESEAECPKCGIKLFMEKHQKSGYVVMDVTHGQI